MDDTLAARKGVSPHDMAAEGGESDSVSDTGSPVFSATSPSTCPIGIDFGRTKCEAAVVLDNGSVAMIPLELEAPGMCVTLPSFVSIGVPNTQNVATGWDVGQQAAIRAKAGHPYTVFDLTLLLGRKLSDLDPKDVARWPFTVRPASAGKCAVEFVTRNSSPQLLYPEQIAAELLSRIKQRAEAFTGKRVSSAVLCVPAVFNRTQRQALRDACSIAGLQVNRFVASSTASAVAHAASFTAACTAKTSVLEKTVLVADCGGGSLDVSAIQIRVSSSGDDSKAAVDVQVKATTGDLQVGGEAITSALVEHLQREAGNEGSPDAGFRRQLWRACALAKKMLSRAPTAAIAIPPRHPRRDQDSAPASAEVASFVRSITRDDLERVCNDTWTRMTTSLEHALELAKMKRQDVELVLLAGDSMHVPKIRALVEDFFAGQSRIVDLTDHTAAIGAALVAAHTGKSLLLHEATSLGLGIRSVRGDTLVLVPPCSSIPTRQTRLYYASCQGEVTFDVLEGVVDQQQKSSGTAAQHKSGLEHCLGRVTVDGSRASPLLILKLEIVFEVDNEDRLVVTALDQANKRTTVLRIAGDETCLSPEAMALARLQLSQIPGSCVPANTMSTHVLSASSDDNPVEALRSCVATFTPMLHANSLSVCIPPGDLFALSSRLEFARSWLDQLDRNESPVQDAEQQKQSALEQLRQLQVLHLSSVVNSASAQLRHQLG